MIAVLAAIALALVFSEPAEAHTLSKYRAHAAVFKQVRSDCRSIPNCVRFGVDYPRVCERVSRHIVDCGFHIEVEGGIVCEGVRTVTMSRHSRRLRVREPEVPKCNDG